MSEYVTSEVRDAASLVAVHLANAVERAVDGMPEGKSRDLAIENVIAWPVIERVIRAYGVPEDVRGDLLRLIVGKAHHNRAEGWEAGYGAGWDAALEVWGLGKCG
jgi:hypothetical protein